MVEIDVCTPLCRPWPCVTCHWHETLLYPRQGRLVRERFLHLRNSALVLQRFFRTRFARRFFLAARKAVIPIQSLVGWEGRSKLWAAEAGGCQARMPCPSFLSSFLPSLLASFLPSLKGVRAI
jgi:hypothetical protein